MPSNRIVVERAVVAAAFNSHETIDQIASQITDSDFTNPDYRTIWRTLKHLAETNQPLDPVLVYDEANRRHSISEEVTLSVLVEISECVWEASHVDYYCARLRQYSVEDDARTIGVQLAGEQTLEERDIDGYIQKLDEIKRGRVDQIATIGAAIDGQSAAAANPKRIHRTGLVKIDAKLGGGIRDGQVVVVGGRPGTGKSVLMMQIALAIAEAGTGALIVSLEMLKEEIAGRLQRTRAADALRKLPLYFIDSTSDLTTILALCKVAVRRHNIGVIVFDYIQLAETTVGKNENRERQIATISRRIKRMALDLQKPIIVGSQLNRESAKKGKPTLADLRESGSIEQDADIVMLLHKSDTSNETTVDIAKHRGGMTGEVVLELHGAKYTFVDASESYEWADKL